MEAGINPSTAFGKMPGARGTLAVFGPQQVVKAVFD